MIVQSSTIVGDGSIGFESGESAVERIVIGWRSDNDARAVEWGVGDV